MSGIFRDLLPLQTKLLAEAALLAATADEPLEQNFVRMHALAFQAEHGGTIEDAALRVFGNADGAYGANVNNLVGSGTWNDEDELADCLSEAQRFRLRRCRQTASAHDAVLSPRPGARGHHLPEPRLARDGRHHGRPLLRYARWHQPSGPAGTGRHAAAVYIGDQTRGDGTIRTISEQVALETRTRALNPKWYEALLSHGYEGVREIEAHVTNTFGWSATTGEVAALGL